MIHSSDGREAAECRGRRFCACSSRAAARASRASAARRAQHNRGPRAARGGRHAARGLRRRLLAQRHPGGRGVVRGARPPCRAQRARRLWRRRAGRHDVRAVPVLDAGRVRRVGVRRVQLHGTVHAATRRRARSAARSASARDDRAPRPRAARSRTRARSERSSRRRVADAGAGQIVANFERALVGMDGTGQGAASPSSPRATARSCSTSRGASARPSGCRSRRSSPGSTRPPPRATRAAEGRGGGTPSGSRGG